MQRLTRHSRAARSDGSTLRTPAGHGPCILLALSDIKIAHSVFAMPFALLGAFLAGDGRGAEGRGIDWGRFGWQVGLVVVCMFFARTWAMLVNRLADARFDAANPRTAGRAIASGRLSVRDGAAAAGLSAACFIAATGGFLLFGNPLPLLLSAPVLLWIAFYSFTKRFTWLCHLFLGGALAVSPLAAAIAVEPAVVLGGAWGATGSAAAVSEDGAARVALLWLAGFILCWVAGFDVAYALQDLEFDRRTGLHSVPARAGARGALRASRGLHGLAFACLAFAWRAEPRFGPITLVGVGVVGVVLVVEHVVLARRGVAGLPLAFFTLNGVVSCVLGAAGIADVLLG
jgi:4-hydroxybenzoate polyprenyltransferase